VWWVSEMWLDRDAPAVHYRHVAGITTGMDVVWSFVAVDDGSTAVEIVHEWDTGPAWPLPRSIRRSIADWIIGPVFIHHVASRTLAGVRAAAERVHLEVGGIAGHVGCRHRRQRGSTPATSGRHGHRMHHAHRHDRHGTLGRAVAEGVGRPAHRPF